MGNAQMGLPGLFDGTEIPLTVEVKRFEDARVGHIIVELAGTDLGSDQSVVQLVLVDVSVDAGVPPFIWRQGSPHLLQLFDDRL